MKLTFVFFAIAILATIGIGFWLSFASPLVTEREVAQVVEEGAVPATPAATPEQISGRASLTTLLDTAEPIECTFRFNDENVAGEGTSFIADGQIRVDALYSMTAGESMTSSYILTDETTYVWTSGGSTNVAMMFPTDNDTMDFEAAAEDETGQFINPAEAVQYTCAPWVVDNSVFTPPADIDFMDFSSMMQGSFDASMLNQPQ